MNMKFRLDKRENSAKKRSAGRVQIKLETTFAKATETAYGHGDGGNYSSDNDDSDIETERLYYNQLL